MAIEIPIEFICPITHEIMTNPVKLIDGFTYEESAISEWLGISCISPITGLPVEHLLTPNLELQSEITRFITENGTNLVRTQSGINSKLNYDIKRVRGNINIQLKPTIENGIRFPTTLIVLVDVSGSMDIVDQTNGNGEKNVYSRLDLVKHTLNALVDSLNSEDSLGIIQFADNSSIIHPICKVIDKPLLKTKISNLRTIGGTNLWNGIQKCLEVYQNHRFNTTTTSGILVFTDGQSTTEPPRGIVETFKTHIEENGLKVPLNILGYGYSDSINSKDLYLLSKIGNGLFGYIPDFSMLGTVFINILSNILASYPYDISINGRRISNVVLNQPKDIVACGEQLTIVNNSQVSFVDLPTEEIEDSIGNLNDSLVNLLEYIQQAYSDKISSEYVVWINELINIQHSGKVLKKFTSALMNDINSPDNSEGQIGKAIENVDWYHKWGRHYIFSIISSLRNQLCFSFKEKAPEIYNGHTFKLIQSRIEKAFINLPVPTPTVSDLPAVTSMSGYYNRSGGCISGFTKVKVNRKGRDINIPISEIRKGDYVKGREVDTIVKVVFNKPIEVVSLGNFDVSSVESDELLITPYHPIKYLGEWVFPINLVGKTINGREIVMETRYLSEMYDILFKEPEINHILEINGWEVIGLGHNIQNDKVATHSYFGKDIVKDIKQLDERMFIPTIYGFKRGENNLIIGCY